MVSPEALPRAPRIRFGPFRFDPHCGELSKGELKLKLQGQPIQLLSALLERRGELVTRDELRQRLWPADTFVDFEHSLNTAIRKLRQALGDEAETPRFIETLPKRGYRFIGEILVDEPAVALVLSDAGVPRQARAKAEVGSAPPSGAAVLKTAAAVKKWGQSRTLRVKLAIIALVAAAAVLWSLRASRPSLPPELVATPLTAYAGGEWEPDLSPDGKMVAFSWDEGDRSGPTSVYVKMVSGSENAIRVAPPESHCPAWSPDGNMIAFVYASGPQPGIYAVSPLGGAMKMLLGPGPDTPVSGTVPRSCNLSWSSDGKWLLFSGVPPAAPQASRAIYKLSVQDGTVSRITNPAASEFGDFYPHFSPDDKLIAFSRWTSADVADAFVVPAAGGQPRRITHDNALLAGLAWTADGRELVISSTRVGALGSALWRVRVADGAIRLVAVPSPFAWQPSLSRRGSRLAYSTGNAGSDISEVSLQNDAPERNVYSSSFPDAVGCYSPDGSKVVFVSGRSGKAALWVAKRDGSALMELVSGSTMGSPRWSPDGKWIAYDAEPSANASLFIVAPSGGVPRRLTDGKAKDIVPTWSRDSQWLYFSSNRTGAWQIFKMPSEGGPAAQVTRNGGLFAQESLDGSKMYFLRPQEAASLDANRPGIWVKSLPGGPEAMVKGTERVQTRYFAISRSGIYFIYNVNRRWILSLLNLSTGRIRVLRTLDHRQFGSPSLAVSPDEKTLLYTWIEADADLMLVDNFR